MIGVWSLVFLLAWTLVRQTRSAPLRDPQIEARPVIPRGDLSAGEQATVQLFAQTSPSVVYITNIEYSRVSLFSLDVFKIPKGTGSGFIYDRQGYIVTNFHVVAGSSAIEVTLADHSRWEAHVVGYEMDKDLAVIKIDAPSEQLKPIIVGSSNDLQVGQKVFAIGNPFGWDQTLTTGIVSALGRQIDSIVEGRTIRDVIQTDAAINPGNSGGPLLDSSGRLIGVNTQIASPSGASAGIGFAVPVDTVNRIVPQIIKYGHVIRPGLGVRIAPDWVTKRLDLPGPLLDTVTTNSAAAKAGLRGTIVQGRRIRQLGDVILRVDDREIKQEDDLLDALERHAVGDEATVTYLREDKVTTTRVILQQVR